MAEIAPFRGSRFDPARAGGDLGRLIAPPYDSVSPPDHQSLLDRSPYNAVRLELPIERPGDRPDYAAAARRFHDWTARGIVRQDERPALYLHEHEHTRDGERHRRLDVIGIVRLAPWHAGIVLPHELTLPGPIRDRLNLMHALPVNLSPLFGLYRDPAGAAAAATAAMTARPPAADFVDPDGDRHRLWLETDPKRQLAFTAALAEQPIFIADGHHRYETALAYQAERFVRGDRDLNAAWNFSMMALVASDDPGLAVLAIHRILDRAPRPTAHALAVLRDHFDLVPIPTPPGDPRPLLDRLAAPPPGRIALGLVLPDGAWLLVRRAVSPAGAPPALDAVVARREVIEAAFGIDEAHLEESVRFTRHAAEAAEAVSRDGAAAALLLNPVHLDQLTAEALAGRRLPQKTSYFYPKIPTGLAFHALVARP